MSSACFTLNGHFCLTSPKNYGIAFGFQCFPILDGF